MYTILVAMGVEKLVLDCPALNSTLVKSLKVAIVMIRSSLNTVLAGGTIPLGAIIRRFGCGMDVNGNGLTICEPGYYAIDVSVTVLPTAATPITATLLRDGVAVPGATATETPTSAGAAVNLSFPALVRHFCNCGAATLTVVLSAAGTVNNMAIVAERV